MSSAARRDLSGLLSAIATPFDVAGGLDEPRLRALVDQQVEDGVDGVVACGSTGEFAALDEAERRLVVEVVADQAAGRVAVVAQTGAASTHVAIELSRHAEQCGADAVLVAPPYYGELSEGEVASYYRAVADGVLLPVCLYHYPAASGVELSIELIVELARDVEQIRYVKDSSGDLGRLVTLLDDHRDDVTVLCGQELLLLPAALLGVDGVILGCANVLAPGIASLLAAVDQGDAARAVALDAELQPIMRAIGRGPYTGGVKAALELLGRRVGPVRPPSSEFEVTQRAELERLLAGVDAGHLTGASRDRQRHPEPLNQEGSIR